MGKGEQWIRRFADAADLSGEILPGIPLVELAGDSRVLIERHRGVLEYGETRICVGMKYGILSISGSCLEVMVMSRDKLVIIGKIDAIQIHRRRP